MKTKIFITGFLFFFAFSSIVFIGCQKDSDVDELVDEEGKEELEFEFPRINNIDSLVYLEIQKTCDAHWDLGSMEATTFVINSYTNEYAVYCAGSLNNQYYWFIIHADNNGKWLSDGRAEYNGRGSFFNVRSFEQLKLEDIKNFWDGESKIDTSMGGRLDSSPGFLDDYTRINDNNDKRIKVSVFKFKADAMDAMETLRSSASGPINVGTSDVLPGNWWYAGSGNSRTVYVVRWNTLVEIRYNHSDSKVVDKIIYATTNEILARIQVLLE